MTNQSKVRVAVIDVGTLKSKFEVREFDESVNSTLVYKDKQLTVLGRDLDKTDGMIIEKSILKTIDALHDFKAKMEEYDVQKYLAVTTEAIRRAKNAEEVLKRIHQETGIQLETLSQDEEAEIYFRSVSRDFPGELIAVSDIGGGSVQVVIGKDDEILESYLFKTGTYYLQEGFSKTHHPAPGEVANAFDYVKKELTGLKKSKLHPDKLVYGSSNIIDFFKAMNLDMEETVNRPHHHYQIQADKLKPLYEKIIALSYEDRMLLFPEEPYYMWAADKALMNIFTISEYLSSPTIVPSNNNISTGILVKLSDEVRNGID